MRSKESLSPDHTIEPNLALTQIKTQAATLADAGFALAVALISRPDRFRGGVELTRNFTIKKGLDLRLPGAPEQVVHDGPPVSAVGLLGADYPGIRPVPEIAEGDIVAAGQPVFRDRRHPEIAFVAPISGRVLRIERGARRSLSSLVIKAAPGPPQPATLTADIRETLLAHGHWPAFQTRPFGRIPVPNAQPEAIFVTATDSHPLCPDPRVALAPYMRAFRRGVKTLTGLTEGSVYVCQSPGEDLIEPSGPQVKLARFSGPHPAGSAGTQVHHLRGFAKGEVWTIGCQDVAAIGYLFENGEYFSDRIIALAGPRIRNPRLIRTHLGAKISDLTAGGILGTEPEKILSGSVMSGRVAAYLGRYHRQITALDAPARPRKLPLSSRFAERFTNPLVPTAALENALPFDIPPIPLMRALSVGDSEAAERLGCLALDEDDVAPLTALCASGSDYGVLLRRVLDDLEQTA